MLYKVEMRYLYGWDDAGWEEGDDTEIKPIRFHSRAEAQAELDDFFARVKDAVAANNMDMEENETDYRIVDATVLIHHSEC